MGSSHDTIPGLPEGLRERHTKGARDDIELNNGDNKSSHGHNEKGKMFGRTPDGTVFTVPQTHDMVSQLLDPREPKNLADIVVIAILGLHILFLLILPSTLRVSMFAAVFLFWRGCYNVGIGYLLRIQSNHRRLVTWARKTHIFENPSNGQNPRPWVHDLMKRELETKIPHNYKFEDAPIEYNAWLVFRRLVDLILMCDFISYCLFAIACGSHPSGEGLLMGIGRWSAGIALIGFNLWVKLDAHRVVKDYAWYWGDFFFLIDQELTFDGVFEMAPHPMYSVGYAGYYGISMMAASYTVLFISILAHVAQFLFLIFVENPHIEKTYNPPPRKQQTTVSTREKFSRASEPIDGMDHVEQVESRPPTPTLASLIQPSPVHALLGLNNMDLFRTTDTSVILLQFHMILLTAFTPSTPFFQGLFVMNAFAWRLWYSIGLGIILDLQSNRKFWTRHFVKYGESTEEAWRQWKGTYHLSMTMCYANFIAACWKMYSFPVDWGYGLVLLNHVVGAGLVTLQIWTVISIYESLGEFGWFYGDFFFDYAPKLTYSGIYRYLNNPERIIGLAGIWGAVFITRSKAIFFLALLSHVLNLGFIEFIEKPHMQKLYGQSLRREAGITKTIKRALPGPFREWHGSVDKILDETGNFVEDFLDAARPKLAAGVKMIVKDTTALFSQYPARITITRLEKDLAGYDPKDYSLTLEGTPSYGAPIRVKWTAPVNHGKKDWVGLYRVADNSSREVTRISSAGRWVATAPDQYDDTDTEKGILVFNQLIKGSTRVDGENGDYVYGEMAFEGDKLFWTVGAFEFRYHHDGKHNVMAISAPFEIHVNRFDEDDMSMIRDLQPPSDISTTHNKSSSSLSTANVTSESTASPSSTILLHAIESALLPVVRNCFDRDPEIAPESVEEKFGPQMERDPKYARRVVFAVQHMFGIEFAPGVVLADGCVRNLAWRILKAKMVLAPYSMRHSKGTTTPLGA